jgi:hypothetical protein
MSSGHKSIDDETVVTGRPPTGKSSPTLPVGGAFNRSRAKLEAHRLIDDLAQHFTFAQVGPTGSEVGPISGFTDFVPPYVPAALEDQSGQGSQILDGAQFSVLQCSCEERYLERSAAFFGGASRFAR